MSKDATPTPAMLPSIVVGVLREKCRQQAATIATLGAAEREERDRHSPLGKRISRRPRASAG